MDDEITIISVQKIKSNTKNSCWRGFLQEITTSSGIFYDNIPETTYSHNPRNIGFDWTKWIGGTFPSGKVTIKNNQGLEWLKNDRNLLE